MFHSINKQFWQLTVIKRNSYYQLSHFTRLQIGKNQKNKTSNHKNGA